MIVIIDYGMGNLRSVQKALEYLGEEVKISQEKGDIERASSLVLPGVGAFGNCLRNLRGTGLVDPIFAAIEKGKPFLGICLGMQALFSYSEEGEVKGLSFIKGKVKKLPPGRKVPHMGWNSVVYKRESVLFEGIPEGRFFYFVHSYYVEPEEEVTVGITDYGITFSVAIEKDNVFGLQFHPEKSGRWGLKVLDNFRRLQ